MTDQPVIQPDFIDFGCSEGGSLKFGEARFGGKVGLGVDIDPAKVATARSRGANAMVADASQLELRNRSVDFCIMVHFLEHLPGLLVAGKCIRSAIRVSRDFVYIRHPWFNSDFDLYMLGYKFYWSDWKGHTSNIGLSQLDALIRRSNVKEWCMYGVTPVTDLNSPFIVPLDAPRDSRETPNDRPSTPLPFQAFKESSVLIRTGSAEAFEAAKAKLARDHVLLRTENRGVAPMEAVEPAEPVATATEQPATVAETPA